MPKPGRSKFGQLLFVLLLAGCSDSAPRIEVAPEHPGASKTQDPDQQRVVSALKAANPDQLFDEAQRAAGMGNLGLAAELLESVIKLKPDHREGLFLLAAIEQERAQSLDRAKSTGPMLHSADLMRQLQSKVQTLTRSETDLLRIALYNEAVAWAAREKPEKALASLEDAVEAGFASRELLKTDKELGPIRNDPRFETLLKKVDEQARLQVKARVKSLFEGPKPESFEFELPDLQDKMVSSRDFRGKVLVVDIWGTWCPPCRREIPHLIELQQKHEAKGFQVVGINYEQVAPEEVKSTIAEFVKEAKIPYPCLIGDEKTQTALGKVDGYPTTLFIDRTGKVRAKLVGLLDMDDDNARMGLDELVTTLLEEKASPPAETK